MQQEPGKPGTAEPNPPPSTPTPEDPRQREPIHDPPVNPEHDIERENPVRQAEGDVVFDENRTPG